MQFRFMLLFLMFALFGSIAQANPPATSLRPVERPVGLVILAQGQEQISQGSGSRVVNRGFKKWIKAFRSRAIKSGVRASTFDRAFRTVRYNKHVVEKDRNQSEFTMPIWDYLALVASDDRVKNGRKMLQKHRSKLNAIEKRYGVDKEVVVAVWGIESNYGTRRGDIPVIEALATLAYDGRRGRFFEKQLIAALKILQNGDTTPARMTGSWAGAMGHTQFIPTSYAAYAVDFTGDGRRDIWAKDPTDALASTAAYLARFGFQKNRPWGVEVKLPKRFDYALASRRIQKAPSDWAKLGVKGMNGRSVPNHGTASLALPAGANGAAFLIFKNYSVISRYNNSQAYVMGVGHLSDRLKGGGLIKGKWPVGARALKERERKELQRRLKRKGYDVGKIDGRIGPNTVAAVRAYQKSVGLPADGIASLTVLKKLR